MNFSRIALLGVSAFVAIGCHVYNGASESWFNEQDSGRKLLTERATFDMGCPADKLSFTPLGADGQYNPVGVTGCDKKATYIPLQGGWVMNSQSE